MRSRIVTVAAFTAATALAATGCGSGSSGSSSKSIKVVYWQNLDSTNKLQANFLASMVKEFTKANPGTKVTLVPVTASENDYYTKLQLMMRSPRPRPTWSTRTPRSSTPTSRAATSSRWTPTPPSGPTGRSTPRPPRAR